jgi:two-component system response regulator GlrR
LFNVVEQCSVLSTATVIPAELVRRALRTKSSELLSFAAARDKFEKKYLNDLLVLTDGNVAQAARMADRSRSDFYKLLKKHDVDPELFRETE